MTKTYNLWDILVGPNLFKAYDHWGIETLKEVKNNLEAQL